jgi:NAD(P)H-hydrate epimerase
LATAGTGDVLTGVMAARLARLLPDMSALPFATAAALVHVIAGRVADERHGADGVVAWDVAEALPEAIERVRSGLPSSP